MPDRILIVAPGGRDDKVIRNTLAGVGLPSTGARPAEIIQAILDNSIGTTILVDEALAAFDWIGLEQALAGQPTWSDCPFLLLTRKGHFDPAISAAVAILGNVTLIERPLHPAILVSAVRAALRARARQHNTRLHLDERRAAEARVVELAATLELRVADRTGKLTRAMAGRRVVEERLRESEELHRFTIELSPQIAWAASADGTVLSMGARWAELTGLTGLQPDLRWRHLIHADDVEAIVAIWDDALVERASFEAEYRVLMQDGVYRWCQSRAAPLIDADGILVRWYGTIEVIEARRQAADRLQQLQADLIHVSRVSAMGAMASTLAHELNQPLTAISNYIRGCQRLLAAGGSDALPMAMEALGDAGDSAIRAGEIVRRLRDQVTRGEVHRRRESLPTLIHEACRIALVDMAPLSIRLTTNFSDAASHVQVDRVQIQQVLINLLRNAVEALMEVEDRQILIATSLVSDALCQIVITDTGPGLDPALRAEIFTPFNSTKAAGMGIGLSISRTIIEEHGGHIWTKPGADRGTTFGFTLVRTPPSS